jgi:hypothetical protein
MPDTSLTELHLSGKATSQALTVTFVVTPVLRTGTYSQADD